MSSPTARPVRWLLLAVSAASAGALAGCDTLVTDALEWGEVEVVARTLGGDPVPDVRLHLFTGIRLMARGNSGPDGRHVFEFVPPGGYGVFAFHPDGHTWPGIFLGEPVRDIVDGLHVEEGGQASATFVFLRLGVGGVRVEVTDESGGGIAGAEIEMVLRGQDAGSGETGPDGVALVEGLQHGLYLIRVLPPEGWAATDGTSTPTQTILVEGGTVRDARVELTRCTGSIVATARDGAGDPVPGAGLDLYTSNGLVRQAETDAEGTFRFVEVGCGAYGVRIHPPAGYTVTPGRGSSFHDGLTLDDGEEIEILFEVERS